MRQLLNQIGLSLLDLLYPPLCLHCEASLDRKNRIFCQACFEHLILIDPAERCPYCFSFDFDVEQESCCRYCRKHPPLMERIAAVFDYEGPAATLVKQLKYGGQYYLSKSAGAYLTAQFLQLGWPMPDAIVPMPMSRLRVIERGYNQSALLANAVGKLLNCPVYDLVIRRVGDFSQAGLNHQQRLQLSGETFTLRRHPNLEDKCLLVIDDVMTTGSSLRCCAEALWELYPARIYGLTVCRTL